MNGLNACETAVELLHRFKLWPVAIKPGGKAPIGESWGVTRPTERTLREMYRRFPAAGVGLLLGPVAGIIDIECDGPEGTDSLRKLLGGDPPMTLGWSSARGPHHLFRYDSRLDCYGKSIIKRPDLPGVEIRLGEQGKQLQSNCPPTPGSDGKPREWNGQWIVSDLPEAVFAFLDDHLPIGPIEGFKIVTPAGATAATAQEAYAAKALDDECSCVALAPDGEQNSTLNEAAFALGQLVGARALDRVAAESRLLAAAAGYAAKDGEAAARATIKSGLSAGEKLPRDLSHLDAPMNGHPSRGRGTPPGPPPWPPLRSAELPAVEPFPIDVLPPPAARLVREGAAAIGCPPDFLGVPALVIAAGAIGRSASLRLRPNYFASTMLFAACVGPPSDGKTPALEAAAAGVRRIDEALAAEYAADCERWEQLASQAALGSKKPKPPPRPKPRRIDVDDMTMEVLPLLLADNPRGLVMIRDELTEFLLGMNQYKAGGKGSDRSIALKLWSGKALKKDRVNHADRAPVRCPHPCISIVGGITPDMLREMADPRGRADGFLDRFLFAYPDPMPVADWTDQGIPDDVQDDWCAMVVRLWSRPLTMKDGRPVPHVVRFTRPGMDRWRKHYDAHAREMNAPGFPAPQRGAWGKFRELAGRLVLVLVLIGQASDPTANSDAVPEAGDLAVDAGRTTRFE
jgi:hypothetical protein